jgi:hypothetical protein
MCPDFNLDCGKFRLVSEKNQNTVRFQVAFGKDTLVCIWHEIQQRFSPQETRIPPLHLDDNSSHFDIAEMRLQMLQQSQFYENEKKILIEDLNKTKAHFITTSEHFKTENLYLLKELEHFKLLSESSHAEVLNLSKKLRDCIKQLDQFRKTQD